MDIKTTKDMMLQLIEQNTREKILKILTLSVPVVMGIFIFLNPFPHTTSIKEICFYGSVFIVLLLIWFKKTDFSFKSPLTLPFALFVIWVFIGLFFALDKENSIHDFRAHLLKYMVFYYILINFFNSKKRVVYLSWIIIISATIFSIGEIYYFYFMMGNSLSTKLMTGLPEIPVNWVSFITVTAIIFSIHYIITENNLYKIMLFIALFPLYTLCVLTQARSATLALFLSVIILCFKNKKSLIACLAIILIVAHISPLKNRFINFNPITSLRLDIHYTTLEIIKDFPIIGIGFGMETFRNRKYINLERYSKRVPEKYRQGYIHNDPHSMPFSIAVRTGLIGLALFLYILFMSFKMCWNCIKYGTDDFIKNWGSCVAAVFVGVIIIGIFEPFFSHVSEAVFYMILAMITIIWKLDSKSNSPLL